MWVGAGRIVLEFYNNDNLGLKKRQLESLFKDLRKKYNLSALEVADHDDLERCVFGFAAVLPETWTEISCRQWMQKVCSTIDEIAFARVSVEDWDLYVHGE